MKSLRASSKSSFGLFLIASCQCLQHKPADRWCVTNSQMRDPNLPPSTTSFLNRSATKPRVNQPFVSNASVGSMKHAQLLLQVPEAFCRSCYPKQQHKPCLPGYVCVTRYACVCVSAYVCVCPSVCLRMSVSVRLCACACLCMSMYVYVCLCMSMYVYVCLCMSMYVYVCLCMSMYVHVCLCMSM